MNGVEKLAKTLLSIFSLSFYSSFFSVSSASFQALLELTRCSQVVIKRRQFPGRLPGRRGLRARA